MKKKMIFYMLYTIVVVFLSVSGFYVLMRDNLKTVQNINHNIVINTAVPSGNPLENPESLKEVISRIHSSVVDVNASSLSAGSAGSGVIIATDDAYSYIVTNHHVIDGCNTFSVKTIDGSIYDAFLVGSDPMNDIAVMKVAVLNLNVATFIEDSKILEVGDTAIAIGNPLGTLGGTVSQGIISALDRELNINNESMVLLQTDAAVNSGNSGGGLFNAEGQLIGIVNAKAASSGVEGLAFAIPANTVKDTVIKLMSTATDTTYGYIEGRTTIGATFVDGYWTESNGFGFPISRYPITYVYDIDEDGSAYEGGLRSEDIIVSVSVNGVKTDITSASQIEELIRTHQIGEKLILEVKRGGYDVTPINVEVTIVQFIYKIE
jgi:serine protease Do